MSPILSARGGLSAGAYGWGAASGGAVASFDSIQTTTLGSSSATVTLSSIPSTYKHLQVRIATRSTDTSYTDNLQFYFNSDTTSANYSSGNKGFSWTNTSYGDSGGGWGSYIGTTASSTPAASASSYHFASYIIDIFDYQSTSKNKIVKYKGGWAYSPYLQGGYTEGIWLNSSTAINSITFDLGNGNFAANSTFSVYGIGD
jgi:hypothetical protein